jgi:hypothetical protein
MRFGVCAPLEKVDRLAAVATLHRIEAERTDAGEKDANSRHP